MEDVFVNWQKIERLRQGGLRTISLIQWEQWSVVTNTIFTGVQPLYVDQTLNIYELPFGIEVRRDFRHWTLLRPENTPWSCGTKTLTMFPIIEEPPTRNIWSRQGFGRVYRVKEWGTSYRGPVIAYTDVLTPLLATATGQPFDAKIGYRKVVESDPHRALSGPPDYPWIDSRLFTISKISKVWPK